MIAVLAITTLIVIGTRDYYKRKRKQKDSDEPSRGARV
jgi:hypothetical protein